MSAANARNELNWKLIMNWDGGTPLELNGNVIEVKWKQVAAAGATSFISLLSLSFVPFMNFSPLAALCLNSLLLFIHSPISRMDFRAQLNFVEWLNCFYERKRINKQIKVIITVVRSESNNYFVSEMEWRNEMMVDETNEAEFNPQSNSMQLIYFR